MHLYRTRWESPHFLEDTSPPRLQYCFNHSSTKHQKRTPNGKVGEESVSPLSPGHPHRVGRGAEQGLFPAPGSLDRKPVKKAHGYDLAFSECEAT